MNILILNWRDIKNPAGGGAEQLTHEMAKRWVKAGHTVTQFSSIFPEGKKKEIIDGVTFIRQGKWWTVHVWAFFYYLKHKNESDIVIDEVHWFPFFAALYAPQKTIALTCEVATQLLFRIFPYPKALFFAVIEKIYLFFYKRVPTMVISPSTKADLIKTGHQKNNIIVIPMGLTLPKKAKKSLKEKYFTLVSVSRLNAQKGISDVIKAFAIIKHSIPECTLWLVGSGQESYMEKLYKQIEDLQLAESVTLWGFVNEEKKFDLLSRAHLLISASMQEGWGLTVPEAATVHTPAVVYNVQGFRDIITNNKNGILVEKNPQSLAKGVLHVLENKNLYKQLQVSSQAMVRQFSWDNAAEKAILFVSQQYKLLKNDEKR
jgi:glycosyltransferase involved in cell wall biosynthesis